eukprot:6477327-Amphidinium_carterae.3
MPLPFPAAECRVASRTVRSTRLRQRSLVRQHRLIWLNGAVSYVNWLVLGKPRGIYLDAVCRPGETFEFSGCGNKISILRAFVEGLHAELCYSQHSQSSTTEAKVLNATNMSLPSVAAQIELRWPLVPCEVENTLASPGAFRMPSDLEPTASCPLFVNVTSWLHWLPVALAFDEEVPRTTGGRHLRSGLFGVEKSSGDKLRIIVDRRRMNSCEYSSPDAVAKVCAAEGHTPAEADALQRFFVLPHPEQFKDLMLTPTSVMHFNIKDCTDYYYFMKLPDHLAKTSVVGWSVGRDEVPTRLLDKNQVPASAKHISFCLRAPAMGAKQFTEIAQCVHQCVLQRQEEAELALQTPQNWMSLGWPPPSGDEWCGAYMDDLGYVRVVANDVDEFPEE